MPAIGLVISSCMFAIPSALFFKNNLTWMGTSCSALTITSVLYHGTLHPVAHSCDALLAHVLGIQWSIKSMYYFLAHRRAIDGMICANTHVAIAMYIFKSRMNYNRTSTKWHFLFHIWSQLCLIAHTYQNKSLNKVAYSQVNKKEWLLGNCHDLRESEHTTACRSHPIDLDDTI